MIRIIVVATAVLVWPAWACARPQTIGAQLARGVPADVVILSREGLTELIEQSRIAAGTAVDLARVGMGVAVPVSELQNVPGVDYAGAFPAELQFMQTFSAAIVRGSKQPDAGRRLIAFLASEHASSVIRHAGMEPLGKRRAQ
jgi:hypothetical protein